MQMTGHSSDEKQRLVGQIGMEAKVEDRACTRVSEVKEAPDMKQLRTEVHLRDKASLARLWAITPTSLKSGDEGAATAGLQFDGLQGIVHAGLHSLTALAASA